MFSVHALWLLWCGLWAEHRTPGDHSVLHSSLANRGQHGSPREALCGGASFVHSPSPGVLQQVFVEIHSIRTSPFHLLIRVLLAEKTPVGCLFQFVFGSVKNEMKAASSRSLATTETTAQIQSKHKSATYLDRIFHLLDISGMVQNESPKMYLVLCR